MFDYLKRKITKVEWYYTCENSHKWKSHNSPSGGVFAELTVCPECSTEVCMADKYVDGKSAGGAIHGAFGLKRKKKEKKMKKFEEERFMTKLKYGK